MSDQRIGKTSEAELNEMAEESYRQITAKKPEQQQPKEHCGHECVCGLISTKEPCPGIIYGKKCKHDTRSCPAPASAPSYDELVEFARFTQKFWREGIEIMRKHNLKIESDTPMEKLAFTFYTNLCEIDSKARHLFQESYGDENYKDEHLPDGVTYSPEHDAAIRREEREQFIIILEKLEDDLMKQIFLSGNRENAHLDFEKARESLRDSKNSSEFEKAGAKPREGAK